jgi:hypothetical protein
VTYFQRRRADQTIALYERITSCTRSIQPYRLPMDRFCLFPYRMCGTDARDD